MPPGDEKVDQRAILVCVRSGHLNGDRSPILDGNPARRVTEKVRKLVS